MYHTASDKTQWAFENTSEMWKTQAASEFVLHFSSVLKCLECFITVYYTALASSFAL